MSENLFNIPLSLESEFEPYIIPKTHKRLLLVPDMHVPYHNFKAIDIMMNYCQNEKLDLILINGDLLDCYQLSKFVKDPRKRNFKEELDMANEMLDSFEMAFPDVKKIIKEGNHEERYETYLKIKAAELLGIEEYRIENLLRLYARGIEYIKDQRIIYAGHLPILHGHEVKLRSIIVNPARTLYLKVKHSAVCSHLHVASQHSAKRLDGHIISTWSTGHLSDEHPEYARYNEWTLGFAIIDFDKTSFEVSNFKIINDKIYRS